MPESTQRGTLRNGYWIRHPSTYPNSPYTYTPDQVRDYLAEIGLVNPNESVENVMVKMKPTYHNLEKIVRGSLCRFPFENTAIHYSPTHEVDVTPQGAFTRLVTEKKGGSYCFGLNAVLYGVLRGLGYRVYSGAGRVNHAHPHPPTGRIGIEDGTPSQRPFYTPLAHMILFVQPFADYTKDGEPVAADGPPHREANNQTYLVDVGIGSPGLARPILLAEDNEDDEEQGVMGVGRTERHRMRRGTEDGENVVSSLGTSRDNPSPSVLDQIEKDKGHWVLQVWHQKRTDSDTPSQNQKKWRTLYSFTETEYFLQDYLNSSLAFCHFKEGIFWENVFACKNAPKDDTDGGEMVRIILFSTELRRTADGKSEVLRKIENERQRLEVLREVFGIVYDVEEALECVKGRAAELPPKLA